MSLMLSGREDEERAWAGGAEPGAEGSAADGAGRDHPASHPASRGPHTEAPGITTDFITCVLYIDNCSVQCCGSGMFIPDPGYPDPGSKRSRIRKEYKNLMFLTQKIVSKL